MESPTLCGVDDVADYRAWRGRSMVTQLRELEVDGVRRIRDDIAARVRRLLDDVTAATD
jgi:hypothetical protein